MKRLLDEDQDRLNTEKLLDNAINHPIPWRPWILMACLSMGNIADAVETVCVGYIMTELGDLSALEKGFLSSATYIGLLFGSIIGGIISDSFGRKRYLIYAFAIDAMVGLISSFSVNVIMLVIFRAVGGFAIGGAVPIMYSLGAEIFPSILRGKLLLILASAWMLGAIFASLFAWLMFGDDFQGHRIIPGATWHHYSMLCSLPSLIAWFLTVVYLPESPRFLVGQKRWQAASDELATISTAKITAAELQHDQVAFLALPNHDVELELASGSLEMSESSSSSRIHINSASSSIAYLIRVINTLFSDDLRQITTVLSLIYFSISFGGYGLSNWISTLFVDVGIDNPFAASFLFALGDLPGNCLPILLVNILSMRWLLCLGMCLSGIACLGFAFDTHSQSIVILSATLFNAFSVVGWNALDCLSAQVFPTVIRATALGLLSASGRLGAICGQFVNSALENNIPLLLFVACACSFFGGIIVWCLPTTKKEDEDDEKKLSNFEDNDRFIQSPTNTIRRVVVMESDDHNDVKNPLR